MGVNNPTHLLKELLRSGGGAFTFKQGGSHDGATPHEQIAGDLQSVTEDFHMVWLLLLGHLDLIFDGFGAVDDVGGADLTTKVVVAVGDDQGLCRVDDARDEGRGLLRQRFAASIDVDVRGQE